MRVDAGQNLLLIRGAVPGATRRPRGGAHRWLRLRFSAAPRRSASTRDVFGARFNGPLVHETVRAELNARRQGTASTKTRGQVRGGGAKPWRQKGTGRARAGSSRSPIWTGGGTIFGPQPRHYTFKVNRKERRAALRSALSVHAERGSLAVLDVAAFETPSTKQAAALLSDWSGGGAVLVVLTEDEALVARSFRNLQRVTVLAVDRGRRRRHHRRRPGCSSARTP